MGICNGFQILVETGLVPGVLLRNKYLEFICKNVFVKINNKQNTYRYSNTNELDERKKEVEAVSLSDVMNNKGFNRKKNGALKKGVWGVRFVVVNYADLIGHGGKRVGVVKARELVFS